MIDFTINGRGVSLDIDPDTPLLWVIREDLGMTGTKFGCGIGMCGACTVHLDGDSIRACTTKVSDVAGSQITTIEGLSEEGTHPVQVAWRSLQVPQCGYCQSGQIMQAASLLSYAPEPSDEEILSEMSGNLCRCMTYVRIKDAVHHAAALMKEAGQ